MYKCNIDLRSRDHSCREKATGIVHHQCVSVALVNQYKAHAPYDIFMYGLTDCTIFFHIIS
jgi:hypothetical protein